MHLSSHAGLRGLPRLIGCAALSLFACTATADILYGPELRLEEGSARTYLIMDQGRPVEIGLAVDSAFINALPEDGGSGGMVMPDGHSTFEYVLQMPEHNPTPFQHVTLDWNPAGHMPEGVYDQPHFDVHFYTISHQERLGINPSDPGFMHKAERMPAPEFIPAGYVNPGLPAVPLMGTHLVDPGSPEFQPGNQQPFSRTFLYGTWDGRLIFVEPMVTTAFLATRTEAITPIPVAELYEPAGYYPASYSIRWDQASGEHRISLTDLQWR